MMHFLNKLEELNFLRHREEDIIHSLSNIQSHTSQSNESKNDTKIKEREYYKELLQVTSEEINVVSQCLINARTLMAQKQHGLIPRQPLRTRKKRLSFWIIPQDTILPPETNVAVRIRKHSGYIVGSVCSYLPEHDKYIVRDRDDAKSDETFRVDSRMLFLLPSLEECPISSRKEFSKGARILAVYPGSTMFYEANVLKTPTQLKSSQYSLMFDDDYGRKTLVDASLCIPLPPAE